MINRNKKNKMRWANCPDWQQSIKHARIMCMLNAGCQNQNGWLFWLSFTIYTLSSWYTLSFGVYLSAWMTLKQSVWKQQQHWLFCSFQWLIQFAVTVRHVSDTVATVQIHSTNTRQKGARKIGAGIQPLADNSGGKIEGNWGNSSDAAQCQFIVSNPFFIEPKCCYFYAASFIFTLMSATRYGGYWNEYMSTRVWLVLATFVYKNRCGNVRRMWLCAYRSEKRSQKQHQ